MHQSHNLKVVSSILTGGTASHFWVFFGGFFPCLVVMITTVPIFNPLVLPDLPLPSHLPTRLETAIYSGTPLHDVNEINKLLNSQQDPVVVQQMASVLCEVDTGFL